MEWQLDFTRSLGQVDMLYLTSLRGIAAILVAIFHVYHLLPESAIPSILLALISRGYLAVDFFFILSGFILAYKYQCEFQKEISQEFYRFLVKRVARVVPLHLFVMLLYLIIPFSLWATGRVIPEGQFSIGTFFTKLFLIDLWMFDETWSTWNTPSWTISGEMFAYLLFPFLALGLARLGLAGKIFFGLVCFWLFALFLDVSDCRSIGSCIGQTGLLRCLVEFTLGVIVFNIHERAYKTWSVDFYFFLFCLSLISLVGLAHTALQNFWYIPIIFALSLLGLLGSYRKLQLLFENKVLVFLGEISYSVYLTHILVREVLYKAFVTEGEILGWLHVSVFFIVTFLIAWALYYFVEVPCRTLVQSKFLRQSKILKRT